MEFYIAGFIVLLLIAIYFFIRNQAKNEVKAEMNEDLLDVIKESQDIRNDVANLSDDNINKLL
jgi:hypothetical protein